MATNLTAAQLAAAQTPSATAMPSGTGYNLSTGELSTRSTLHYNGNLTSNATHLTKFELVAGDKYSFSVPSHDYRVTAVYDASGVQVATVPMPYAPYLDYRPTTSGTYYVGTDTEQLPTGFGFSGFDIYVYRDQSVSSFLAAGPRSFDLRGTSGNDTLTAERGHAAVWGLGGNDLFGNVRGRTVIGGDGIDTVWLAPSMSTNYGLQRDAATGVVTARTYVGDFLETTILIGVERIKFSDTMVALDVDGTAGQAYRLYQAAFDRTPDAGGLGYHLTSMDTGASLRAVANTFIASPEFNTKYGALNNTAFATQLYANVLHRAPDAGGLAYHVANLDAGMARADVLIVFSESQENQAALIGVMSKGMAYTG